uniref:DNA-directed RNA polymerase n=1 Tax=Chaetophoropsis polyrhiza TaxID=2079440 RepID=A0A6H1U5P3_9CHLO|nr:alpha subunit of RNA polymerase [Chaetophoropsis polyrhiza]QIZ74218.1 alpha subunit of RNA polymerase [Chaetophoropsis polyrhiza]
MLKSHLSEVSSGKVTNPILVSCRESIMETKQSFYGKFYIGPLAVGQGLTLANALRRTLLSELVGLAITSVSIEGVTHEYATLKGVRESVLDILLNLKQIVLKSKQSLKRPQTAYLYYQGPGTIRAGDLILPATIQCVDPEQYIATLSSDGFLKIKLIIRQGKNYLVQTPNLMNIREPISSGRNNLNLKTKTLIPFFKYKVCLTRTKKYSDSSVKISRKKLNIFKNYRSLKNLFQNSKNKELFLHLFKKQILSILAAKMAGIRVNYENYSKNDLENSLSRKNSRVWSRDSFFRTQTNFWSEGYSFSSMFFNPKVKTKALFIDAVFMPVTKVNYTLEESRQKLVDSTLESSANTNRTLQNPEDFATDLWNRADFDSSNELSTDYQQEKMDPHTVGFSQFGDSLMVEDFALPKSKQFGSDDPNRNHLGPKKFSLTKNREQNGLQNQNDLSTHSDQVNVSKGKRKKEMNSTFGNNQNDFLSGRDTSISVFETSLIKGVESEQTMNETKQTKAELALYFKKNWLNSTESWLLFSSEFNTRLFDNFNQFPKDIIILEIWTNGSILPRTALKQAAQNLSNLVVKFEHAKIMGNTFIETNKTYSQTIQKLYEKYKKL